MNVVCLLSAFSKAPSVVTKPGEHRHILCLLCSWWPDQDAGLGSLSLWCLLPQADKLWPGNQLFHTVFT